VREKSIQGRHSPTRTRHSLSRDCLSQTSDFCAGRGRQELTEPLLPNAGAEKGPMLPVIAKTRTLSSPERTSSLSRSSRQLALSTDELHPMSPSGKQLKHLNYQDHGLDRNSDVPSRGHSPDRTPPGPAQPTDSSQTNEQPIRIFQLPGEDQEQIIPLDTAQILRMQVHNNCRPVSRRPKTVSVIDDRSKPLLIPTETLWPELKNLPNEGALEARPAPRVKSSRASRRSAADARHVRGPGLRTASAVSAPRRGPQDVFGFQARNVYNARTWTPSMTFPIQTSRCA